MNIETLSDVPLYAARPPHNVAPERKATSWIVVGVVHFLMFSLLTFTQTFPLLVPRGAEHETVLVLDGAQRSNAPSVKMMIPKTPMGVPPVVPTIQIPPPPPPPTPEVQQPAQREGARDGDLLGAVGRELACRAGSYENLNDAQRARCARAPWQGVELPNGAIVLARPQVPNAFTPPPEYRVSGADANRLQIERNNPCPVILNVPCLNQIPGRD